MCLFDQDLLYSADDDFTELANPAERLEELLTRYFVAFIKRKKMNTVAKKNYTGLQMKLHQGGKDILCFKPNILCVIKEKQ